MRRTSTKRLQRIFLKRRSGLLAAAALWLQCCALMHADISHGYQVTPVRHLFDVARDFLQPSDVAAGAEGRIYVLDGVNHRVAVFDAAGAYLFSFGGRGRAPGLFAYPLGIAIDSRGRVYVADTGNRRIQIFDARGTSEALFDVVSPDGSIRHELPTPPSPVSIADTRVPSQPINSAVPSTPDGQ